MPDFGCIGVTLRAGAAHAVIDWPSPHGSVNDRVFSDFEHLVDWLEDEHPGDAVVVSLKSEPGEGAPGPRPDLDQCRKWEKLLVRVDRLACLSVARVDGACSRFWLQLALACDHRIATTRASFQVHEVKEGYLPGMNIFRLAKYVGIGAARRVLFTGERLEADAAAALGLVDRVCAPDDLDRACFSFLARLEPIQPVAVQLARRLLNESFSTAFEQLIGHYLASQHRCLSDTMAAAVLEPQ